MCRRPPLGPHAAAHHHRDVPLCARIRSCPSSPRDGGTHGRGTTTGRSRTRCAGTRSSSPRLTLTPPPFSLQQTVPQPRTPPPAPLLTSGVAKSLHHLGPSPTQPVAASSSSSCSRPSAEDSRYRLCNPCLSIHHRLKKDFLMAQSKHTCTRNTWTSDLWNLNYRDLSPHTPPPHPPLRQATLGLPRPRPLDTG